MIENLDDLTSCMRWRQARRSRLIDSIGRQIQACTVNLPSPMAGIATYLLAHNGWQCDHAGTSFATVRPVTSSWETIRPIHAIQFLVYRPDREGD